MTLRLLDITALAHPSGNRIDLTWSNPQPALFPGIRVVRREGAYPVGPQDGELVLQTLGVTAASDNGLRAETVYYYALFPYVGSPPPYDDDPHNRVSAMATGQYGFADRMYQLLPSIYRRYDAQQLPPANSGVSPQDLSRGLLRRYLDLPGGQLDQFFSLARSALELHDVTTLDGALLPLLAQWIGWRTNYALPLDAQRNEIRFAPELYRTTGSGTAVDATVDRVTGWPVRTKEYVHNVARTNQPERLNLWAVSRNAAGAWGQAALASVNFAYDGRPSHVTDQDGSELFLVHTYRPHGWDIWAKRFVGGQWQPSEPVVDRRGTDKYPSAALQGSTLWLFWGSYDATTRQWRIWFQTRVAGVWTAAQVYGDTTTERRNPAVVADGSDGIWLFWREWAGGRWQVRFNRNNGTNWQLSPDGTMPLDGGQPVDVDDDLIAVINPSPPSPAGTLWLFWSRHDPASAGQTRWSIAWRVKPTLDPTVADWSAVRVLPKASTDVHDREPAPLPAANGNLELFWATTRGGGWSISHAELNTTALTWSTPDFIAPGPYSQRAPLAISTGSGATAGTLLTFRSNQSVAYQSPVSGAQQTLDERYAGTTTVRATDTAKLALRGAFEDFQAYTYQGGVLTSADRITRGTIGLFVTPGTTDATAIQAAVSRLKAVLPEFMPVTVRAVVVTP